MEVAICIRIVSILQELNKGLYTGNICNTRAFYRIGWSLLNCSILYKDYEQRSKITMHKLLLHNNISTMCITIKLWQQKHKCVYHFLNYVFKLVQHNFNCYSKQTIKCLTVTFKIFSDFLPLYRTLLNCSLTSMYIIIIISQNLFSSTLKK